MAPAQKEIGSTEEFYAHALAIEREAAMRYWELAHHLLLYHKHDVAAVLLQLARLEYEHMMDLERRAAGMALPRLAPSEHCWRDLESRDGEPSLMARCLTRPRQAFEIALRNERHAKNFYDRMSATACDSNIRRLAAEQASEEAQHIAYIERALQNESVAV